MTYSMIMRPCSPGMDNFSVRVAGVPGRDIVR